MKTTAWTAPDARRWWQWVGPWPLLPLIDGIFAAGLAFAARSESITRDTALSESAIALAYGVIVGAIVAASRRWLSEFAESGLGYFATIAFAALVGTAFRDAQGVVLNYPAQPPWIDFTIAMGRSVIAIVILQAVVGALQTRLQQQVVTTAAALDVVEQQAEALLRADEEVRSSVASLLHDRVQGGLLAACLRLQAVAAQQPVTRQEIDGIIGDLERLRALDVRRAVRTLSPSLRDVDLETAIRDMVEPFQPAIAVSLSIPRQLPDDPTISLGSYRIIEQGLLNAIDHGRAQHVDIAVTKSPDQLEITVRDDGVGLGARPRSGFGITLVDTWCRTLGGDWELRPADGGGTVLIAHLPVPRPR